MYKRDVATTGNSNWQADAYLIDLLRLYHPESILDLGVGKWAKMGNLIRRSIDEWNYIQYGASPIRIVGVEGYRLNYRYITDNYPNVYDVVHLKLIEDFITEALEMSCTWDVIILGDVLEHINAGFAVIKQLLELTKKAIIVQLPLGEYKQEVLINPLENHRETWTSDKIAELYPAGLKKFVDYAGRDFVVFSIPK
jgi:hypothetical protein